MKAKAIHITEPKETEIGIEGYRAQKTKIKRRKEMQRYWAQSHRVMDTRVLRQENQSRT
jgi:hypothetical protein